MDAAIWATPIIPPDWVTEFKFHPTRKWRFDFAWPRQKIALEVEGGIFQMGRHNRPAGFIGDCEKYNEAAIDGWTVIRMPVCGKKSEADYWVKQALALLRRAFRGDA